MVTLEAAIVPARVLDTSTGGLSLRIEEPWECKLGQKVEVEVGEHDVTLAEVVRIEHEDGATILGLMRLAEKGWDENDRVPTTPIRAVIKRKRNDWLPGMHAPVGVLLLIIGMAIGFMVWRPQSAVQPHSNPSPLTSKPLPTAARVRPAAPKPPPRIASGPAAAPERGTKSAPKPSRAAPPAPANGKPQWPVSVAPSPRDSRPLDAPRASSVRETGPAPSGDFQNLLPRLPRSIQFQFRQLETQAMSPGPDGAWRRTQDEVRRVIEQLEAKLTSIFVQSGSDESAVNRAAQPVLDEARRQIDSLHGTGQPPQGTGEPGAGS